MQARPVMSSFDPGGQVQRKLPNVLKQLPFLHGVILHSSTSIVKEKTSLPLYIIIVVVVMVTYLLLNEFEGRTVSYGTSFFPFDLWPKRFALGP